MNKDTISINGIILIFLFTGCIQAQGYKTAPPEPAPNYWSETVSAKAGLNAVVHAGVGQIMDRPQEWGGGVAGFGERAASGFGTHLVKNTIEFPVAAILHEDLRYHRSPDARFGPRLRHALVSTVWTPKTTTHENTVAVGRISGALGGGLISRLWQPASVGTVASGFASGGISLGADAGVNGVREFWPRSGGSKRAPLEPQ